MKYLLTILFLVISSAAYGQKSTPVDYTQLKPEDFSTLTHKYEFYDEHSKQNYRVINDKREKGVEIQVTKNGKTRYVKHGAYYSFYEGYKTRLRTYNFGKQDGVEESYNNKGVVKFSYVYKDNLKHGPHVQRNEKNQIVTEVTYVNDNKEGIQTEYYNEKVSFTKTWENGELNGEHLQYNSKGKIVAKTIYKNNKPVGKTVWY